MNGNTLKFCRDLESDRTVKNDVPHSGLMAFERTKSPNNEGILIIECTKNNI